MKKTTKKYTKKKPVDVYQKVTDIVIAGLDEKGLNWFKSWTNEGGQEILPLNHKTGYEYKGINVFICYMEAMHKGYSSNEWIGYKQAMDMGNPVRKDQAKEYTELVLWYKMYFDKETDKWIYWSVFKKLSAKLTKKQIKERFSDRLFPKVTYVYHIEQLTNPVKPKYLPEPKPVVKGDTFNPIKEAEKVYENMAQKPSLNHGGGRAYYNPPMHHVQMPNKDTFNASGKIVEDDYYKTLYHELMHSTGHQDLLNRKTLTGVASFGDETYSQEELVAEIGAMMMVSKLNLKPSDNVTNSKAYINGWVKHLKNHKKEVLFACSQAQKGVQFILGEDK